MIELRISQAAAHSIVEQADYYLENVSSDLALRWEGAIDEAIQNLLRFPESGTLCRFRKPALAGLRWALVPGFQKHLIFYRYATEEQAILVVQVLHGARDLEVLLSEDS